MRADPILFLPFGALPTDDTARARQLRDYFPDKRPLSRQSDSKWEIHLPWPRIEQLRKDPCIKTALPTLFGETSRCPPGMMKTTLGKIALTASDSWTLLAWSHYLSNCDRAFPLFIIHVDAHSDLMAPIVETRDSGFTDLITGEKVRLCEPCSVEAAIHSGAIGIGSFLVPFLWEQDCDTLVHLCTPSFQPQTRGWGALERATVSDTLLKPGALRPAVRRTTTGGLCKHLITESLENVRLDIHDRRILLHIDLDFFNNRYNGDSHWFEVADRHDPDERTMRAAVESFTRDLRAAGVEALDHIVISCSPEFCPAEHWSLLIKLIEGCLGESIR